MVTPSSPFSFLDDLVQPRRQPPAAAGLGGPRDPAPRGAVPEPRAAAGARGAAAPDAPAGPGGAVRMALRDDEVRRHAGRPARPGARRRRARTHADRDRGIALRPGAGAFRGDKPAVRIEGDVQLAAEVNWLVDHVRWDVEDDLARAIGDVPAHTIATGARRVVGGAAAASSASAPARPAGPRAPNEAFLSRHLHRLGRAALRPRRARPHQLPEALAARGGPHRLGRPQPRRAARPAPARGARAAGPDLRQVRPGAVDPARPAAARHRRRAGAGCRTACRLSRRRWPSRPSSAPSAARSATSSCSSTRRRWPARRSRRCTSRPCAGRRHACARRRSRCCAPACAT